MSSIRPVALSALRVPGMDTPARSDEDASESELVHLRDRMEFDHDREIDPHAARGAAIQPEPML